LPCKRRIGVGWHRRVVALEHRDLVAVARARERGAEARDSPAHNDDSQYSSACVRPGSRTRAPELRRRVPSASVPTGVEAIHSYFAAIRARDVAALGSAITLVGDVFTLVDGRIARVAIYNGPQVTGPQFTGTGTE
jgi:hypothetical protein